MLHCIVTQLPHGHGRRKGNVWRKCSTIATKRTAIVVRCPRPVIYLGCKWHDRILSFTLRALNPTLIMRQLLCQVTIIERADVMAVRCVSLSSIRCWGNVLLRQRAWIAYPLAFNYATTDIRKSGCQFSLKVSRGCHYTRRWVFLNQRIAAYSRPLNLHCICFRNTDKSASQLF